MADAFEYLHTPSLTICSLRKVSEAYNVPSQKLCEKLGLFREFVSFVNDEDGNPIYENTYQYAMLKKEWQQNDK